MENISAEDWKALAEDERMEKTIDYYREVYDASTPGHWGIAGEAVVSLKEGKNDLVCLVPIRNPNHWIDRKFIAMAHKIIPALIQEIDRLKKE